jgi:hypothetical protein
MLRLAVLLVLLTGCAPVMWVVAKASRVGSEVTLTRGGLTVHVIH